MSSGQVLPRVDVCLGRYHASPGHRLWRLKRREKRKRRCASQGDRCCRHLGSPPDPAGGVRRPCARSERFCRRAIRLRIGAVPVPREDLPRNRVEEASGAHDHGLCRCSPCAPAPRRSSRGVHRRRDRPWPSSRQARQAREADGRQGPRRERRGLRLDDATGARERPRRQGSPRQVTSARSEVWFIEAPRCGASIVGLAAADGSDVLRTPTIAAAPATSAAARAAARTAGDAWAASPAGSPSANMTTARQERPASTTAGSSQSQSSPA